MSIPPWNPPEGREQEDAKPEEESTNDFLFIKVLDGLAREMRSDEQSLSPIKAEPIKEEAFGTNTCTTPLIPAHIPQDIANFAALVDSKPPAAATAPNPALHNHDTRYQRRQQDPHRQRHNQRDSISPSRVHSRSIVHRRPAVLPRKREWLWRIAQVALEMADAWFLSLSLSGK